MDIWTVEVYIPYECTNLVGVYSTEANARIAAISACHRDGEGKDNIFVENHSITPDDSAGRVVAEWFVLYGFSGDKQVESFKYNPGKEADYIVSIRKWNVA